MIILKRTGNSEALNDAQSLVDWEFCNKKGCDWVEQMWRMSLKVATSVIVHRLRIVNMETKFNQTRMESQKAKPWFDFKESLSNSF